MSGVFPFCLFVVSKGGGGWGGFCAHYITCLFFCKLSGFPEVNICCLVFLLHNFEVLHSPKDFGT